MIQGNNTKIHLYNIMNKTKALVNTGQITSITTNPCLEVLYFSNNTSIYSIKYFEPASILDVRTNSKMHGHFGPVKNLIHHNGAFVWSTDGLMRSEEFDSDALVYLSSLNFEEEIIAMSPWFDAAFPSLRTYEIRSYMHFKIVSISS